MKAYIFNFGGSDAYISRYLMIPTLKGFKEIIPFPLTMPAREPYKLSCLHVGNFPLWHCCPSESFESLACQSFEDKVELPSLISFDPSTILGHLFLALDEVLAVLTGKQWGSFTWLMDGQREATLLCSGGGETEASGEGVSDSSRAPTFSYVQKLYFTSLAVFMYKESSSTQASESALGDCWHTVVILMVY